MKPLPIISLTSLLLLALPAAAQTPDFSAADAAFGLARLGGVDFEGHLWHHAEFVENDDDMTEAFTLSEWASV